MANPYEIRDPIDVIRELQNRNHRVVRRPKPTDRIGFAFSSKDRYRSTLQTIRSLDAEHGFDIVWNDGSADLRVPALARNWKSRNATLVEVNTGVHGGPDSAIRFGLGRLLELGYDYAGLIENDVVLDAGWFGRLMGLFSRGADEGLVCGAASVRAYESRVLEYRDQYSIDWACGAGMVLFSRRAAELIHEYHAKLGISMGGIRDFYGDLFGLQLRTTESALNHSETPSSPCATDLGYSPFLYSLGFATLGAIPSMAFDLESNLRTLRHSSYVAPERNNAGIAHPRLERLVSAD